MAKLWAGLAATAIIGLAACGGSGSGSRGVASLAGSRGGGGATTTTVPKGNATQLYSQWAACMRQHGVQMADPTIDSQGQVSVNAPQTDESTFKTARDACQSIENAARAALGGSATRKPDPTKLLNFSKCMRAHGLRDFPDPGAGGGLQISAGPNSDLNPNNPTFQHAQAACQHFLGNQRGGMRVQMGGPGGPGASGGTSSGGPSGGGK